MPNQDVKVVIISILKQEKYICGHYIVWRMPIWALGIKCDKLEIIEKTNKFFSSFIPQMLKEKLHFSTLNLSIVTFWKIIWRTLMFGKSTFKTIR